VVCKSNKDKSRPPKGSRRNRWDNYIIEEGRVFKRMTSKAAGEGDSNSFRWVEGACALKERESVTIGIVDRSVGACVRTAILFQDHGEGEETYRTVMYIGENRHSRIPFHQRDQISRSRNQRGTSPCFLSVDRRLTRGEMCKRPHEDREGRANEESTTRGSEEDDVGDDHTRIVM
jgi:hypothetical protein